jgi:hypothetical protein
MTTEMPYTFKSHVGGKNADVTIHADRIEWALEASKLSMSRKQRGSEMIPMRMVSSVATHKNGLRFTIVRVISAGNTIDFRVGHAQAKDIKDRLTQLLLAA